MLLGFKRRFAPMVEEGSKTHTMRAIRKTKHSPRVGDICHCYVDPRQETMRLLGRFPCTKVEDVTLVQSQDGTLRMFVDGEELSDDEKNAFAWRDGFRSRGPIDAWDELTQFWLEEHGKAGRLPPFAGHIIHWQFGGGDFEYSRGGGRRG